MSILGLSLTVCLVAQSTVIQWSNPSFEDIPGPGRPPLGWYFCGPPEETPPDVQPIPAMNVTLKARHGKTYAGLVVRDNNTRETLGQILAQPIMAGNCYVLRLYACRSENFASYSRLTGNPTDFTTPVRLQIWGGTKHCDQRFLLAQTKDVTNTSWRSLEFLLRPPADCDQLFFTATYGDTTSAYNGHLLIDHLSPLAEVDCDEPEKRFTNSIDQESATTQEDLKLNIQRELTGVQWVRNGFSLRQEFFQDESESDEWLFGNRAIYRITASLRERPDALLTVAVGPFKHKLMQHHIRLLAAEFMAAGLAADRCLIRPMRKRDIKKGDWLNSVGEGVDLLWGVSYR